MPRILIILALDVLSAAALILFFTGVLAVIGALA